MSKQTTTLPLPHTQQSLKMRRLRVWDLPTRLFHWALVFCVALLIISGNIGGDALLWHFRLGYCLIGLLLFRIIWGFVGGYWSRFQQFVYHPRTVLNYLRGKTLPQHEIGHNPLGALSVWSLLVLLSLQVTTGLMSDDEITNQGLLVQFISPSLSQFATGYHKNIGKILLISLICLHISAIGFYWVRRKKNLVTAMLNGDKYIESHMPLQASKDTWHQHLFALAVLITCTLILIYATQRLG